MGVLTTEEFNNYVTATEKATGHSVYGGSSLPRIVDCPASVRAEMSAPLQGESVYAAAGTLLHNLMEVAMKAPDPYRYITNLTKFEGEVLTIEQTVLCLDACEYVQSILKEHEFLEMEADGSYEIKIDFELKGSLDSYGLPEVFGTMDVVIKSPRRIDVIDYKFGYGVAVYAKENYQLTSYLGMAVPFEEIYNPDQELHIHICQPTKHIYDDWQLDHQKMYQMILGDITDAITESRSMSPKFGPSEKACRFCRANMRCKDRHNWLRSNARMIQQMSNDPSGVTNEQWSEFLEGWSALKNAARQVETFAMSEIMSGKEFPHYKLVSGRANRKFKEKEVGESYIKQVLGDKAYVAGEPPIISLALAEKLHPSLKSDPHWADIVYKPEGAPKLVKADEKGKAMTFGVASVMDDIAAGNI